MVTRHLKRSIDHSLRLSRGSGLTVNYNQVTEDSKVRLNTLTHSLIVSLLFSSSAVVCS